MAKCPNFALDRFKKTYWPESWNGANASPTTAAQTPQNNVACFHRLDHASQSTTATGVATALWRMRNPSPAARPATTTLIGLGRDAAQYTARNAKNKPS